MRVHHKHLHLARRKMGHILDEIYTALLHYGSEEVDLRIVREEEGLRLFVKADFHGEYLEDIERMGELLPQLPCEDYTPVSHLSLAEWVKGETK
jgi:hypothetical protein